ncbi:MAG: Stp1/IreP family PP2C-type Ser/Thr phosphatase [Thermoleophilaceae bacterium]
MALRIADQASLTDVGRQRHTNEDNFYAQAPVFAVADGMGGAQAGEVASEVAVEEFKKDREPGGTPEQQLEAIATAANRKIWEMAQADSRQAGMGTTLTAVVVGDIDIAVAHVGDSRLYRQRDGTLERLTRDHSLVEEFVRQGRLTPEQAERHPQRSVITRALGPESDVEVETFTVPARDGDVYLLCSDGLSGMVSDADMQRILAGHDNLPEAAKALIEEANRNGGRDNITAVLFRVEDDGTGGDARRIDTADYDTIAGDVAAPSAEEIEAARETASHQGGELGVGSSAGAPTAQATAIGSPLQAQQPAPPAPRPNSQLPTPSPANFRRPPTRRKRLFARAAIVAITLLLLVSGGLYLFARSVWFLGTDSQGVVTLYRGLPYDLPLGVHLYQRRFVSGVPALSLAPDRRKRVLDHQLRSHGDAVDLIRSLVLAESR